MKVNSVQNTTLDTMWARASTPIGETNVVVGRREKTHITEFFRLFKSLNIWRENSNWIVLTKPFKGYVKWLENSIITVFSQIIINLWKRARKFKLHRFLPNYSNSLQKGQIEIAEIATFSPKLFKACAKGRKYSNCAIFSQTFQSSLI